MVRLNEYNRLLAQKMPRSTASLRLRTALACLVLFACACTQKRAAHVPAESPPLRTAFRVEQRDGQWSFIDPLGERFFSIGINCINPVDPEQVAGPKYDGLARHNGDLARWENAARVRLRDWHVNTIGAWSSLRGRPYVVELSLSYSWIDVFGEEFESYVEEAARKALQRPDIASDFSALDQDAMLIGYFTDNELAWGWDYGWAGEKQLSLFEYYASLESSSAGKKAWVRYLSDVYQNNWNEFSRIWNVTVGKPDDLGKVVKLAPRSPAHRPAAQHVADGFLGLVAERYFKVTSSVMRQRLPSRLNLGCRFTPGVPQVVAEIASRYVDAISYNMYTRDLEAFRSELTRLHAITQKPILVTEFAFLARVNRSGNKNEGYDQVVVGDDQQRALWYTRSTEMLGDLPFVVGFHWFQFHDEPTNGRKDGESCNFGFVDLEDRVYDDLARAAARANARVLKGRMANP